MDLRISDYEDTSLIRNRHPVGPYSRTIPTSYGKRVELANMLQIRHVGVYKNPYMCSVLNSENFILPLEAAVSVLG